MPENNITVKSATIDKERTATLKSELLPCEKEVSVIEFFGLRGEVNEMTEINTDFGLIVALLYFYSEKYTVPKSSYDKLLTENKNLQEELESLRSMFIDYQKSELAEKKHY